MTPAIAALVLGGILIVAGFQGRNVVDVALGRDGKIPDSGVDSGGADTGATATDTAPAAPTSGVPAGLGTFDGKPVAKWIVTCLTWARNNGHWTGSVTSGYRDPNQVVTPSPGLPVAPQGKSNHNKTTYPGGAVDVTDPTGLARAMAAYPGHPKLHQGLAIGDPIHFSATGR